MNDNKKKFLNKEVYKVVRSDSVYNGRIVKLYKDSIKMPKGNTAIREVVETTNSVAIVALNEDNNVYLIKQYRHPQKEFIWEIPAGRIDIDEESELQTAKRELEEEVGLTSKNWSLLGVSLSSPGFTTEKIHIFLAKDVYPIGTTKFQAKNEELDLVIDKRPLNDVVQDVLSGLIIDGKTIVGLLLTEKMLSNQ